MTRRLLAGGGDGWRTQDAGEATSRATKGSWVWAPPSQGHSSPSEMRAALSVGGSGHTEGRFCMGGGAEALGGSCGCFPVCFPHDVIPLSSPGASRMPGAERRRWWLGEYRAVVSTGSPGKQPPGQGPRDEPQNLRPSKFSGLVSQMQTQVLQQAAPRYPPLVRTSSSKSHRPAPQTQAHGPGRWTATEAGRRISPSV